MCHRIRSWCNLSQAQVALTAAMKQAGWTEATVLTAVLAIPQITESIGAPAVVSPHASVAAAKAARKTVMSIANAATQLTAGAPHVRPNTM